MNPGIAYAALAYLCWGLFPLYFKQLSEVPALEVVAHRTLWSLCFVALLLTLLRRWTWAPAVLRQPRVLGLFLLSACLLVINSLAYVWAVQHGHVLEGSLGYFINPLINVALGFAFLRERPRPLQWLAVGLAAFGVLWVTTHTGRAPWIALIIAFSFGFYGLVRKTAPLGALEGLTLETLLIAPVAAGALAVWTVQGHSAFALGEPLRITWLLLAGPLTAVPLLLFAAGARRLPLTTLGLIQYISPTMQFLLGVWLFREPLEPARLVAFACIWAALALYSLEGLWTSRRAAPTTLGAFQRSSE
ncbi:EamA family transporter RarD [Paucibacter sp. O1-1]|nr:EamA family transporter RarD [Paucibacter sp. O1-1]MDA3826609.1 EamA family transporter RarD [Paucibacter sp. O1-1]